MARPSKYKKEFAKQVKLLCEFGATDAQIAEFFSVDVRTIHRWKIKEKEFCHSLKIGKDSADDQVERALFNRAVGYSCDDTHISNYQGAITITPIVKEYPPDPTSCIFWLKNRRKDDWRDKPEGENDEPTVNETVRAFAEAWANITKPASKAS